MRSRDVSFFLALATLLFATGSAVAGGSPISGSREAQLPRVCKGLGIPQSCTDDSQCPSGRCEINFLRGPDAAFMAEVTLIIDDDVSKFHGDEEISDVKAATVLIEIKDKGETHLLAQTYQNLEGRTFEALAAALKRGPFLADMESGPPGTKRRAIERRLFESKTDDPFPSILDDFLFEEGDNELADAVRALFGITGRPIIAEVPEDAALVQRSDHVDDALASLVRMKVKIRFVAPVAP